MRKKRYDIKLKDRYGVTPRLKEWLKDNNIKSYSWYSNINGDMFLSFKYEEDATAFKLGFL